MASTSLGSFGVVQAPLAGTNGATSADTFEFFGETFTVNPRVSAIHFLEYVAVGTDPQNGGELMEMAALRKLLKASIASDADYERFIEVASDNGADLKLLHEIAARLYFAVTRRPTQPPVSSSDGRLATSNGSKTESSPSLASGQVGRRVKPRKIGSNGSARV